ncbi:MAG: hypothetical protein OXE87_04995 [Chloroflexi bacterium]|nr:hypothetical protein [Chloroflexota bacterium]
MNQRINGRVGRRRSMLSLALVLATAGLIWFGMLGGVGTASADGGTDAATQGSNVIQEYNQEQNVANCFLGIPCLSG